MKIYRYLWVISSIFLILIGCSKQDITFQPQDINESNMQTIDIVASDDQIKKDFEFLTSVECDGRKPGTLGNEKAANYISNRFKDIGLIPLLQDYKHSYFKETEILDKNKILLEILEDGNVLDTFIYGEDYIELFIDDAILTMPLLLEPKDTECAVLVEDITKGKEYLNNPKVKLLLRKDIGSSRGGFFYQEGVTPQLRIYQESYDRLLKYLGKEISFSCDIDIKEKKQDNIVGVIKGKDGSNAIIISAHYDHLGSAGDKIWRGALDNASGVCLLLETAKVIKNYYIDNPPPFDIIFCAFNSEENAMAGSRYFNDFMVEEYQKFFNINLDSIGNKDYKSLFIHRNDSEASNLISDDLVDSMFAAGIVPVMKSEGDYSSDQESFTDGIVLTTISNIKSSGIHTLEDVSDNIDTGYLFHLAGALGNYITEKMEIERIFKSINQENENEGMEIKPYEDMILSKEEFEEIFDCKLSFVDEALSSIRIYGNRKIVQANMKDLRDELKSKTTLLDIRRFMFELDSDETFIGPETRLNFTIYKKDDPLEMESKQYYLTVNGYNEESLSKQITIGDISYYIPVGGDNRIETFFENEEYYLWITINISNLFNENEEPTQSEFIEKFNERLPVDYIQGMKELLLTSPKVLN